MAKIKLANLGSVGLIKDIADGDLPPEAFTDALNVRFNREGAIGMAGHRRVFKPVDTFPTWIRPFPPITNPVWVYADQTSVWTWDGITHSDITRVSGPYTGDPQRRWQGEVFNGVGIFNNGVDVPQMWLGFSAGQRLQDLSAWPEDLTARWIRPFGFFLIAGYMGEGGNQRPFRVRWSHPAEPGSVPASWALDDPTKDSGELDFADTPDYTVDGLGLGELFIVYKEKTAWAMQYVGGQGIFNKWQIIFDRGLLWQDCVQAIPGGHFVVGQDDIYIHTGQRNSVQSIVQDKLRQWIFKQISSEYYYNSFTLINRSESEVWFCFPEDGAQYATLAMVWNWTTNAWGTRQLPEIPFAASGVVQEESELDTWGSPDVYAWGDMQGRSASVEAVADRVNVGLPSAMEAQAAATNGSAEVGVPGWPAVDGTYYGTIYGSGGPTKLSDLVLTTSSLLPYTAQPSKIILTVQPGVTLSGAYGNANQAALWIDQLYQNSQVILNLEGAQITGVSGGAEENGFPAVLVSGNASTHLKVNGGDIDGGAAGSNGTQGYAYVLPSGSTFLDQDASHEGDIQYYGGLSASISDQAIATVVPNGAQTLGSVDVVASGFANDKNPRLQVSRVSGDSAVGAIWDRSDITYPMRVTFTSNGTDRRREATFEITLLDSAGRSIVAGLVDVEAVHGNPVYVLTVDPSAVSLVVQLPGSAGASSTWGEEFNATVQGGIGPFLYDWTTTVGTITSGQTTATVTLEQASGTMAAGEDKVLSGNLTLTVTDTGQGNDQIVKVVPVYLFFDNSIGGQQVTGLAPLVAEAATVVGVGTADVNESFATGAMTAGAATTSGSGTVVPIEVATLAITPSSVSQTVKGPGTGTYNYTLTLNLSAVLSGTLEVPFQYDWGGTGWTFTGDGNSSVVARRTFSCGVDQTVNYSGTISCDAEDEDFLSIAGSSIPVSVVITNPAVKQIITGSGVMLAQSADSDGIGFSTSPSVMNITILPGGADYSEYGASATFQTNFTASRTGGVGPFTYSWTTSFGEFSPNSTSASVQHSFLKTCPLDGYRSGVVSVSVSVQDLGRPGSSAVVDTATVYWELSNGEIP